MEDLEWREVTSSNIRAIAHVGGQLFVRFTNGSIYRFSPEPEQPTAEELYDLMAQVDDDPKQSVGSIFHAAIRGKVPGEKVTPTDG